MSASSWPDYRAVWRWHFYAGLICIPFVVVLSLTGCVYLFKPQIEAWTERSYNSLTPAQSPLPPSKLIDSALRAFPGSVFSSYELPADAQSAARIVLATDRGNQRVYVHPGTASVLGSIPEDQRIMRLFFRLHGELLMGDRGSNIVETAACWTIVLLLSGIWLWWPRSAKGLAGVLYPRLFAGSRLFWRDLHAVVGLWVTGLALFLLLTGLPWAKFWGDYFKAVRQVTGTAVVRQDWSNTAERRPENTGKAPASGEHSGHSGHGSSAGRPVGPAPDLTHIDQMVATVAALHLDAPVIVAGPGGRSKKWTGKSDTANRPRRVSVDLDPQSGQISGRQNFSDRHWIDRAVAYGIAAHEGQLFGWANVALGLLTGMSLILLSVSGVIMWWKRRDTGVLGAPKVLAQPQLSGGLLGIILLLGLCFPLFAATLCAVLLLEWLVLRRIPAASHWLGLQSPVAVT
jgi:uncharacterized iron-regulated membrane protein